MRVEKFAKTPCLMLQAEKDTSEGSTRVPSFADLFQ